MAIVKFKKQTGGVSYEKGADKLSFINNGVIIGSTGNNVNVMVDGVSFPFSTTADSLIINDVAFVGDGAAAQAALRDTVFNP